MSLIKKGEGGKRQEKENKKEGQKNKRKTKKKILRYERQTCIHQQFMHLKASPLNHRENESAACQCSGDYPDIMVNYF